MKNPLRSLALVALTLAATAAFTLSIVKDSPPEVPVAEGDVAASVELSVPVYINDADGSYRFDLAEAEAAGTYTVGSFTIRYFTNGKTEYKVAKNSQVYFVATLTSAQTTLARGVYNDVRTASGGLTATSNDAKDGETTFPHKPSLGDMTD